MTSSTPIIGTKVGRARRRLSQLWQVPTFLVGLLALLGTAVSAPFRHSPEWYAFEELVAKIRRGVEEGPPGSEDALVSDAERALDSVAAFPERTAEAQFLAGSAYYRQAKQKSAPSRQIWPLAADHLEKALALQMQDSDRPAAQYRLGYALYQQGKEPARAVDLMTQAVEKGVEQQIPAYELLVQANLQLTPPNLDGALTASRRILDLTPESPIEALAQARLAYCELLMRKEMRSEALKVLDQFGAKVPRPLRIKARLMQARCCEEEGLWNRAGTIWQELLKDAAQIDGGRARILYRLGWCHHQADPPKIADTIKVWTEALHLGGPAGQAAGLHLGELRMSQGDSHAREALDAWKQAMEIETSSVDFKNPYIEFDLVKGMFDNALLHFHDKQEPQKCQEVAEFYRKIAPGGQADLKMANAARASAEQMKKKGSVPAEMVAAQFRQAGDAFELAARAGSSADRPAALWHSIQCFLAAKDDQRAQTLLHQFVNEEKSEARLAEGWFTLGDLYRLQSKKADARAAYVKCLQYPSTPFAYRARYWLAVAKEDDKKYDEAIEILKQNLEGGADVDRGAQEKSLFKMTSLLMEIHDYSTAMVQLKDFIRLYPANKNVIVARAQMGNCYHVFAQNAAKHETEVELDRAKGVELTDERKLQLDEQIRAHRRVRVMNLGEAITIYQGVIQELLARSRDIPLSTYEQVLIRRASLGKGECHLEKQEYDEALSEFVKLREQRQTVESLYANWRIATVAYLIKEPRQRAEQFRMQAKESLRMMAEDLQAMPADHEAFRTEKSYRRDEWQRWANDMNKKLFAK